MTFSLDPDKYLEGSWQNGPLIPATNRFQQRRKASYLWRGSTKRHPYVEYPSVKGFPMDSITVAVWVKIDKSDPGGCIFDVACDNCLDRCPASIRLMSTRQGAHVFLVPTQSELNENLCGLRSQRPRIVNSITKLSVGEWRHVAVVLDGAKQIFKIYVDGEQDGSAEGAIKFDLVARRKVRNIILGRQYQKLADPVHAAFDDLQMWDRALSSSEIKDLVRIDCEWSGWSEWSECTSVSKPGTSYNSAIRVRTRKITLQPKHGGLECPADLREEKDCRIMTGL